MKKIQASTSVETGIDRPQLLQRNDLVKDQSGIPQSDANGKTIHRKATVENVENTQDFGVCVPKSGEEPKPIRPSPTNKRLAPKNAKRYSTVDYNALAKRIVGKDDVV